MTNLNDPFESSPTHNNHVDYDDYDDYEPEFRSCTNGDYGPSNPWDAPGMSIRDFI